MKGHKDFRIVFIPALGEGNNIEFENKINVFISTIFTRIFNQEMRTIEEVKEHWLNLYNVVLEDGEMFGPEGAGFQRICVPSPRNILENALNRIYEQFKDSEN